MEPEVVAGPGPKETVDHPSHYQGANGIEAIDAIYSALGLEGTVEFCRGNALKYLLRAGKKGLFVEDIKKAAWYLNWIAEHLKP